MDINLYDITMNIHYDIIIGNDVAIDVHCEITMDDHVARDVHCDVTMCNDVAMCTHHDITMHNDVVMNIFSYVFSTLCLSSSSCFDMSWLENMCIFVFLLWTREISLHTKRMCSPQIDRTLTRSCYKDLC